ncbi:MULTISPECIES: hypothetical protein [unclassified Yoonia]|uniref:hypothetical protein n=1 Tax=unclassified Yoonia TaxID=2629118 RepID=UPI002AFFD3C1|nr:MULTISPECIES: hypothetical protein [unclassified Yoonia]
MRFFTLGLALAVAGSAAAQDTGGIVLDLNRLDPVDNACRLTFVADNALVPLTALALETVLFDQAGRVAALTLFDLGDLPLGSRRVRQFDVAGIACGDIAQVLVNGVASCTGANDAATCAQALRVSGSVEGVEVMQ